MPLPHAKLAGTPAVAGTVALALLLLAPASPAEQSPPHTEDRLWTVTCGLPLQPNPLMALLPTGGLTGPWPDTSDGHLEAKTLHLPSPEGTVSTEMWVLSRGIGWWRLKAIRVHLEDQSKTANPAKWKEIRQIIDSPFLPGPVVVTGVGGDGEATVTSQILALMPDASRLRCAAQSDG
ncbi:MAG: hypothetical protein J4F47_11590 [Alphaproteobacteria bacterium]|nr:hypothetical protein [Alphaproteobacteria bacterium]